MASASSPVHTPPSDSTCFADGVATPASSKCVSASASELEGKNTGVFAGAEPCPWDDV